MKVKQLAPNCIEVIDINTYVDETRKYLFAFERLIGFFTPCEEVLYLAPGPNSDLASEDEAKWLEDWIFDLQPLKKTAVKTRKELENIAETCGEGGG